MLKKEVRNIDGVAKEIISKHDAYVLDVDFKGVSSRVTCPVIHQDLDLED